MFSTKMVRERADIGVAQCLGETQKLIANLIGDKPQEHLIAVYLDIHCNVLGYGTLGIGTHCGCTMDFKELVRQACFANADSVILAHNHPSGSCTPSPEDIRLTERTAQCLSHVGIILNDHVIVTHDGRSLSMRNEKLFTPRQFEI